MVVLGRTTVRLKDLSIDQVSSRKKGREIKEGCGFKSCQDPRLYSCGPKEREL